MMQDSESSLIAPHGGKLVNQISEGAEAQGLLEKGQNLVKIPLSERLLADVECIATGVYSPLTGFMTELDYTSVVENMRLQNDTVWSVPVTLMVDDTLASQIETGTDVALTYEDQVLAILTVEDKYKPDKKKEARSVYQTEDEVHPGVSAIYNAGDTYLGGTIKLIAKIPHADFLNYRLTPQETRKEFASRGWKTVVAFQTRNPIHRAHEYLQKSAMEIVDGLFVNPLVGKTKSDDIPADVRMQTYETILSKYYPENRTFLSVFPAAMRYAGPREAIMHAIARKNYGCTHFIVGRDHAGVGNYYGTYDAQNIFDEFISSEIGIRPLKYEHAFYCSKCQQMGTDKTCPHDGTDRLFLSGTKVRAMLFEGEMPPPEFTRKEVAQILLNSTLKQDALNGISQKGVTVWFTGLSGSGKSTVAQSLNEKLREMGHNTEILDGDIIRQNLTKGLGFSKEDRDENIRRIGFVAGMLTRNNVIVICAAISPYKEIRDEVRSKIGDFVEVYVNTPLEVCESRDVKGLYARARSGEIKNFTGISDPYEEPTTPEIELLTDKETVEESTQKVLKKLSELGYLNNAILVRN